MKKNSWIFLFAIALVSCNSNTVFEDYKSFEDKKWNADSSVVFNYSVADTTSKNQLIIKVRHTVDYDFQNLFLFVKSDKVDTLEVMLANKEGMWLGTGVGDIRELEVKYKKDKIFDKKGNFTIEIEQAMRYGKLEKIQALSHISAIGISIQKQDE